ncbi:SURF1 family protein [Brevibacterium jeotgali]|uniref:SURF1-like protein n=1 Tax=Brevibacterium jeotgali TaxID=1262550 RepID=A0A2H1L1X3_9MICO|nr:SURF1 family protein [Brevibacterium jeotgali]TWC02885.1 cytochrome oxidase assembly protein ShyY1 [Brevibacterium jeotgali]SMY10907.1 Cytochrome oxidase assembly protein ShyY1 [Brevibacterium jeotgali]
MRFLLSRRWLQYFAFAVLAALFCGLLASWQNDRREDRDAEIERIERHYGAPEVPLSEVLPDADAPFAEHEEWTHVRATGTYRADESLVARNRPKDGGAGYWVLVPFDVEGGGTLLVARGWEPGSGADATAAEAPAPPPGEVTLSAWLRPAQDGDPAENTGESVVAIDPPLLVGDDAYANAYGYLDAEEPAPAASLEALPVPNTDPGSHLSYTFQWITFGIMILGGVVYAAKRERAAIRRGERDAEIAEDSVVDGVEYVVVDKEALRAGGVKRPGRSPAASRRAAAAGSRSPEPRLIPRSRRREQEDEDAALDSQLGV